MFTNLKPPQQIPHTHPPIHTQTLTPSSLSSPKPHSQTVSQDVPQPQNTCTHLPITSLSRFTMLFNRSSLIMLSLMKRTHPTGHHMLSFWKGGIQLTLQMCVRVCLCVFTNMFVSISAFSGLAWMQMHSAPSFFLSNRRLIMQCESKFCRVWAVLKHGVNPQTLFFHHFILADYFRQNHKKQSFIMLYVW